MTVWKGREIAEFVANSSEEESDDEVEVDEDAVDTDFLEAVVEGTVISSLVLPEGPKGLYGDFLSNKLGMKELSTFSTLFTNLEAVMVDGNAQLAVNATKNTSPMTFFGTVRPVVDRKLSPRNQAGLPFILIKDGVKTYNTQFWAKHKNVRNNPRGGKTTWMNLGFEVPNAFLAEGHKAEHSLGKLAIKEVEADVKETNGRFIRMQLYDKYAHAFAALMSCPIVHLALCNGFQPVFVFKNIGFQKNKFDGGFTLGTFSHGAHSSFLLMGFIRVNPVTKITEMMSLEGVDGGHLAPRSLSNEI
jgi:hypothetical protein